jgi:hypothetical protein
MPLQKTLDGFRTGVMIDAVVAARDDGKPGLDCIQKASHRNLFCCRDETVSDYVAGQSAVLFGYLFLRDAIRVTHAENIQSVHVKGINDG